MYGAQSIPRRWSSKHVALCLHKVLMLLQLPRLEPKKMEEIIAILMSHNVWGTKGKRSLVRGEQCFVVVSLHIF
jgi:hypothetical protein